MEMRLNMDCRSLFTGRRLVDDPLARFLDMVMHGIRSQIQFTRPSHKIIIDHQFVEFCRIASFRKNTAIGRWLKTDFAFETIGKFDIDAAMLQNAGLCYIPIHPHSPSLFQRRKTRLWDR